METEQGPTTDLTGDDYRTVFENISDAIIVHPPDSATILEVNDRAVELFGYDREELLEMEIPELTADDWEPPVTAAERVQQARDAGTVTFEWRNEHKNGTLFWVEVNLSLVGLDGQERVLSSIRDISERKKRERRETAIFDQTYQFTGLLDPNGTTIEANQTALNFGDLDREDVIGKPFWEAYWWQTGKRARRSCVKRLTGPLTANSSGTMSKSKGTIRRRLSISQFDQYATRAAKSCHLFRRVV